MPTSTLSFGTKAARANASPKTPDDSLAIDLIVIANSAAKSLLELDWVSGHSAQSEEDLDLAQQHSAQRMQSRQ